MSELAEPHATCSERLKFFTAQAVRDFSDPFCLSSFYLLYDGNHGFFRAGRLQRSNEGVMQPSVCVRERSCSTCLPPRDTKQPASHREGCSEPAALQIPVGHLIFSIQPAFLRLNWHVLIMSPEKPLIIPTDDSSWQGDGISALRRPSACQIGKHSEPSLCSGASFSAISSDCTPLLPAARCSSVRFTCLWDGLAIGNRALQNLKIHKASPASCSSMGWSVFCN